MLMRMLTVILGVVKHEYDNGDDDDDDYFLQLQTKCPKYIVRVTHLDGLMQPRPSCPPPLLDQLRH